MKKLLIALAMIALIPFTSFAFDPDYMDLATIVTSATGDKQAYTPTSAAGGYFFGYDIDTDGTNNVTAIVIYDNTTATAPIIVRDYAITTSATSRKVSRGFDPPLAFNTGVYITATCSGAYTITAYVRSK